MAKELDARIDHLEKISESRIDKNKPSFFASSSEITAKQLAAYLDGLVGLGYSAMARALYHFRRQSMVKGAYNLRKAWVTFKDASEVVVQMDKLKFEKDPDVTGCLSFGLGLFNFLVSLVPPSLSFIVKMLGFEGDRQAALTQLTHSRESLGCKRIEATLGLFGLRRYFTDEEEGADFLLEEMLSDYPDSPMVLYLCAMMFRFKSETDRSLRLLQHAVEVVPHDQIRFTLNYHLATTYVMTAQYEEALKHHKIFRDGTTGEQFKVWSSFQSALAHWILTKDRALASPLFQYVLDKGKSDVPLDKIAMRKAKEYFKQGESISEFNTNLTRIQHIHEGQLWDSVLVEVKAIKKIAITPEEKAVIHYYRGSAHTGKKNYEKAAKYYKRVLTSASSVKHDNYSYIVPYTWTELGETELALGNLAKAKEYLKKAKKFEDYDWANLLSVRISSSMDKLARREYVAKYGHSLVGPAPVTPRAETPNGTQSASSSAIATPSSSQPASEPASAPASPTPSPAPPSAITSSAPAP